MFEDETYRIWTEAFCPGPHYKGDSSEESKLLFFAPGENGAMSGMVSRIKENRPHEYVSIAPIGIVHNGKEDTSSEEVESWAGALENYTFRPHDGRTEVLVARTAQRNIARCSKTRGRRRCRSSRKWQRNKREARPCRVGL
jgi:hypothetical protein